MSPLKVTAQVWIKRLKMKMCAHNRSPSIFSMPFWCKNIRLSESVTRWLCMNLTRSRSHGTWVRTCQSSQEIQAKLYLPTVTCGGGAPHNTAWSYLGLSMWAHKHHLSRIVALHWATQHSRRQTKPLIYIYMYTIHTSHSLWVTVSQRRQHLYLYWHRLYWSGAICRH